MKRMFSIMFLLTALTLMGFGCGDKEGGGQQEQFSATLTNGNSMAWSATSKNLTITASGDWQIAFSYPGDEKNWCGSTILSGTGSNNAVWLQTTRNTLVNDRVVDIAVTSGGQTISLQLTQTGKPGVSATILGAGSSTSLPWDDTQFTVRVGTTNETTAWQIAMNTGGEWCTPSQTSGTGSKDITFNFTVNSSRGPREATFSVVSTAGTIPLAATQRYIRYELAEITEPQWFIDHPVGYYGLEYNIFQKHAKWVAWPLYASMMEGGRTDGDPWTTDPAIPAEYNIQRSDYQGQIDRSNPTGAKVTYDRGHICPSMDRTKLDVPQPAGKTDYSSMNIETFIYSNCSPQLADFNQGIWVKLETCVNKWGKVANDTLYICAGGDLTKVTYHTSVSAMAIPDYYFKVILRKKADGTFQSIGFWFENKNYGRKDSDFTNNLDAIIKPVRWIEQQTGLNFFHDLPVSIQNQVEQTVDRNQWNLVP